MPSDSESNNEFVITAGNGDIFRVEKITDASGNARYQTDRGLEVIKNPDSPGLFDIPFLGIFAVDNLGVQE